MRKTNGGNSTVNKAYQLDASEPQRGEKVCGTTDRDL